MLIKVINHVLFLEYYKNVIKIVTDRPNVKYIALELGTLPDSLTNKVSSIDEAYTLDMDLDNLSVVIKAQSATGIFYGIQSLISLLSVTKVPPKVSIVDGPRFTYR